MSVRTVTGDDFGEQVAPAFHSGNVPVEGSLEWTHRCNFRCKHCYVPVETPARNELTTDEWRRILDEMAAEGTLFVLVTGGDPLLRPDFRELWRHAKSLGFVLHLYTNGSLVTDDMADFLADHPPLSAEITLYGATEATYERVTGRRGMFERALAGADRLLERDVNLGLKTMAMTLNDGELDAMRALAIERGCDFKYDPLLNHRITGDASPAALRLDHDRILELDRTQPGVGEELCQFYGKFDLNGGDDLFTCGAGVGSFAIGPTGDLTPCLTVRRPAFSLREGSFAEGWHDFLPRVVERQFESDSACRTCSHSAGCTKCPGWAQMENLDWERPVEFLCGVSERRSAEFGGDPDADGASHTSDMPASMAV